MSTAFLGTVLAQLEVNVEQFSKLVSDQPVMQELWRTGKEIICSHNVLKRHSFRKADRD